MSYEVVDIQNGTKVMKQNMFAYQNGRLGVVKSKKIHITLEAKDFIFPTTDNTTIECSLIQLSENEMNYHQRMKKKEDFDLARHITKAKYNDLIQDYQKVNIGVGSVVNNTTRTLTAEVKIQVTGQHKEFGLLFFWNNNNRNERNNLLFQTIIVRSKVEILKRAFNLQQPVAKRTMVVSRRTTTATAMEIPSDQDSRMRLLFNMVDNLVGEVRQCREENRQMKEQLTLLNGNGKRQRSTQDIVIPTKPRIEAMPPNKRLRIEATPTTNEPPVSSNYAPPPTPLTDFLMTYDDDDDAMEHEAITSLEKLLLP